MCARKRKTRSDKFPLTLHKTGQYCKKIKGKIYYFGKDKQLAMERYLDQAALLHSNQNAVTKKKNAEMPIENLVEIYLKQQLSKVHAAELTACHYTDQVSCLTKFANFIGRFVKVKHISPLDLQRYKLQISKSYCVERINLNISIVKAMFHWAYKSEILETIPNVDNIRREKVGYVSRFIFLSEQIKQLVKKADD